MTLIVASFQATNAVEHAHRPPLQLFQIVRSRQLSVLQDQLKEMVVEEDKDSTKINEKALFLSMRNQHFLTLLMEAPGEALWGMCMRLLLLLPVFS